MALADIDHIVVLVMENRSFDHMLGYLTLKGRTDIDGLKPGLSNPDSAGMPVTPSPLTETRFDPGPSHDHFNVMTQLGTYVNNVPQMNGFIADYATVHRVAHPDAVMGYYDEKTVWFYDFLAAEYLVCDRWFSSFPGPTQINRSFLLAGHSANKISNVELLAHTTTHRVMTVFDALSHAGVSWKSYFHDVPELRSFIQFTFQLGHIEKIDKFYAAAKAGTLPAVSWIDPNFELQGTLGLPDAGNDDHPPADVTRGQELVHQVYAALSSNTEKWKKTLLIVTYDEHGGFYDHVPPPLAEDRAPFRKNTLFDRFGVRVPAFVISPWVPRGGVSHTVFEHTSIARTILERFGLKADADLMGARLANAPLIDSVFAPKVRTDVPSATKPAAAPATARLMTTGGATRTPTALAPVEPSELQRHLRALRLRLLGEGMPPDIV